MQVSVSFSRYRIWSRIQSSMRIFSIRSTIILHFLFHNWVSCFLFLSLNCSLSLPFVLHLFSGVWSLPQSFTNSVQIPFRVSWMRKSLSSEKTGSSDSSASTSSFSLFCNYSLLWLIRGKLLIIIPCYLYCCCTTMSMFVSRKMLFILSFFPRFSGPFL